MPMVPGGVTSAVLLFGVGLFCDARRLRALPDDIVATHDTTFAHEHVLRMIAALILSMVVRNEAPQLDGCAIHMGRGHQCHPTTLKSSADDDGA